MAKQNEKNALVDEANRIGEALGLHFGLGEGWSSFWSDEKTGIQIRTSGNSRITISISPSNGDVENVSRTVSTSQGIEKALIECIASAEKEQRFSVPAKANAKEVSELAPRLVPLFPSLSIAAPTSLRGRAMRPARLPGKPGMVSTSAVAVVAAGGFLAESAPMARLQLSKVMHRLGEPLKDRVCLLLSHEQRRAFEDSIAHSGIPARYSVTEGIRCYRMDSDGKVVPERWSNGCNAWTDVEEAEKVRQMYQATDSSWRCLLVRELVREAWLRSVSSGSDPEKPEGGER